MVTFTIKDEDTSLSCFIISARKPKTWSPHHQQQPMPVLKELFVIFYPAIGIMMKTLMGLHLLPSQRLISSITKT